MRKVSLLVLSLLLVAGVFRLGTMDSTEALTMHAAAGMQAEMPDCPMGFVCPAHLESARLVGAVQPTRTLGLLAAYMAAGIALLLAFASFRPAKAPPLFVFTDSGPPALRSVFKKE